MEQPWPLQEKAGAVMAMLSADTPRARRQAIGRDEPFTGRFALPLAEGEIYMGRTSPIIEGLAGWTLDQALDAAARDPDAPRPVATCCGVMITVVVPARVTLLVARFRFHLHSAGVTDETRLCEEIVPLAGTGPATGPHWLSAADSGRLLEPAGKVPGTRPEEYGLPPGERLNETITQSWNRLHRHWADFRPAATNLIAGEPGNCLTNGKWSLPLLRELGFGWVPTSPGPVLDGRAYPINHCFGPTPLHLIGCWLSLDLRPPG